MHNTSMTDEEEKLNKSRGFRLKIPDGEELTEHERSLAHLKNVARAHGMIHPNAASLEGTGILASPPPSPLQSQVGGAHYKDFAIQPVEFCQRNRLATCESNAIKYLCRHRSKGSGRQDIEKAIHYLQLLLEIEYPLTEPSNRGTESA